MAVEVQKELLKRNDVELMRVALTACSSKLTVEGEKLYGLV